MDFRIWAKLLLCIVFICFSNSADATHIIGGSMSYDYLGGNDYNLTLRVWYDCDPGSAGPNDPLPFYIRNENGQLLGPNGQVTNQPINVPLLGLQTIIGPGTGDDNPCFTNPPDICIIYGIYRLSVTLPNGPQTYQISSNNCCRNGLITNIIDPQGIGATYTVDLPHNLPDFPNNNSSATFPEYPDPPFMCSGVPFISNFAATDEEGDSLVYELYTPFNDNNPIFLPVTWANGFSEDDQIGGTPPLSIDTETGIVTAYPTGNDLTYVIGVSVTEYRNGMYLSKSYLELQFTVTECEQVSVTTAGEAVILDEGVYEYNSCTGLFYTFDDTQFGNASGDVEVEWLGVNDGSGIVGDFGENPILGGSANNPFVIFPESGTYELQIVAGLGTCKDTASIIFNMFPIDVDFVYDVGDCEDYTVDFTNMTIDPSIVGREWDFGDGSPTSTDESPSHTFDAPGMYTVTLSVANTIDCSGVLEQDIIISDPLSAIITTQAQQICAGDNFSLNGQFDGGDGSNINIAWGPDSVIVNGNSLTPTAEPTEDTWVVFTVNNASGCIAKDSVFVTVFEVPELNLPETGEICAEAALMLDPTYLGNYTSASWTPATGLTDANALTPMASPSEETTYTLTVFNEFCDDTDQITVQVIPPLDLQLLSSDQSICEGSMVMLEAQSSNSVTWSPSSGLNSTSDLMVEAMPTQTETYQVLVSNSCFKDSASVTITVDEQPTLSAGDDIEIDLTDNPTGQFDGSSDFAAVWSPPLGITDPSDPQSTVLPETTTSYTLSSVNGLCSAEDQVTVKVNATISIEVPSGFSPNGDGLNEALNFKANGIDEIKSFVVYNRWGEQLYQGSGFDAVWDGDFEGNKQPSGVYVYYIEAVTVLGNDLVKKGNATLLR